jgi:hypothetical protein
MKRKFITTIAALFFITTLFLFSSSSTEINSISRKKAQLAFSYIKGYEFTVYYSNFDFPSLDVEDLHFHKDSEYFNQEELLEYLSNKFKRAQPFKDKNDGYTYENYFYCGKIHYSHIIKDDCTYGYYNTTDWTTIISNKENIYNVTLTTFLDLCSVFQNNDFAKVNEYRNMVDLYFIEDEYIYIIQMTYDVAYDILNCINVYERCSSIFSEGITPITFTASKNVIIINDTGYKIAVVNTIGEKDEIDWNSFVPIWNGNYLNFTDKDGDITILFDVNTKNGSPRGGVLKHFKIDSNRQTIIRFYIDVIDGMPKGSIYYRDEH